MEVRQAMRRAHGFTLIELLVVIAIIAILAAILFPVFAKAREKARQASCCSNHKQVGLAVLMYAQDYDERLPAYWYTGSGGISGFWQQFGYTGSCYECVMVTCYPYIKNKQLFVCPSKDVGREGHGSIAFQCRFRWVKLAEIKAPVDGPMIIDANCHWVSPYADNAGTGFNTCNGGRIGSDRHNEGMNICFADGHAKWQKEQTVGVRGSTPVPSPFFDDARWR
jgi:prepilin-type N-terminal cleavage/methylation domain-containing protein/prepilin-type processing-associated H-X9-DG protein